MTRLGGEMGSTRNLVSPERVVSMLIVQKHLSARRGRRAMQEGREAVERELWTILFDPECRDGLATVLDNVRRTAEVVRERLSFDTFRILRDLTEVIHAWELSPGHETDDALRLLNRLIQYLAAFNGMVMENMTRGYGWRFLDMGRRLERLRTIIQLIQQLAVRGDPESDGALELLLELADSTMTYRARYQASPRVPGVLDLLLSDDSNPRSAVFQIATLGEHMQHLPAGRRGRHLDAGSTHHDEARQRLAARGSGRARGDGQPVRRAHRARSFDSSRRSRRAPAVGPYRRPILQSFLAETRLGRAPRGDAALIFDVRHKTTFTYEDVVSVSHHVLHLAPRPHSRQICLESSLTVDPKSSASSEGRDYFGNPVHYLTVQQPHERLIVEARARVDVAAAEPLDLVATPAWEQVRQVLEGVADPDALAAHEFRFDSPYVATSDDVHRYAAASFTAGRPILEAVMELTGRIFREFEYRGGVSDVSTPVGEVLAMRKGVCQDFAHLTIACLRSVGLPARYVSGYLLTRPPGGQAEARGFGCVACVAVRVGRQSSAGSTSIRRTT